VAAIALGRRGNRRENVGRIVDISIGGRAGRGRRAARSTGRGAENDGRVVRAAAVRKIDGRSACGRDFRGGAAVGRHGAGICRGVGDLGAGTSVDARESPNRTGVVPGQMQRHIIRIDAITEGHRADIGARTVQDGDGHASPHIRELREVYQIR